jgi:hypothetical protein
MNRTTLEFNTERIEYIQLTRTRPSGLYFQNETPAVTKNILGLFKWVVTLAMPEGYRREFAKPKRYWDGLISYWIMPENISRYDLTIHNRLYLQLYPRAGSEVRYKAIVYVRKHRTYHTAYFDSDEAALKFIEEVKVKSGDNFQVIEDL